MTITLPKNAVPVEPYHSNKPPAQGRDGEASLSYYDRERLLHFSWNGQADHIQISHGGIGEKIVAHIPIEDCDPDPFATFRRHIFVVQCPECGEAPTSVTEGAEVEYDVEAVDGPTITLRYKEWFGVGAYTLSCVKGHKWQAGEANFVT